MTVLAAFAIYFVIWWTVLFCVLPLNIQSQFEKGDVPAGTEPGAPASPQLGRKAILTSILAGVVFAIVYAITAYTDY